MEDYCYAHNHLLGVFDEEGRGLSTVNNVKKDVLPYLVTSGVGKLRSKKAMQDVGPAKPKVGTSSSFDR